MIYTDNQKHLLHWLSRRNKWVPTIAAQAVANVDAEGNIRGVVGIDRWNGFSCELHMAGQTGWLTRNVLRSVFRYVFDIMGCAKVVVGLYNPTEEILELDTRIGFTVQCRIPDAAPGGDLVIISMDRASCKWLEN